nr:right-handed parallel beta-helix repeat-containing protein [Candidatus Freyarchaeota archaeon]
MNKSKASKIITLLLITALILPIGIPLVMATIQTQNQLENIKNQMIINTLTPASSIQPVKIGPSTIIVPDNYSTIQAAVNAASNGDIIIVRDGTYTENVDVNKSLIIKSENGAEATIVQAANQKDNAFEVTADYVNISGFTVKGASVNVAGICLSNVKYCKISNNIGSGNDYFIYLNYTTNSIIENNNASSNAWGIVLVNSGNNIVRDNNASSNSNTGIDLHYTGSNNNLVINNNANLNVRGIYLYSSNNNTIKNNTCLGNEWDGIMLSASSSYNIIENNTCSSGGYGYTPGAVGISLEDGSSNNAIKNNTCSSYSYGILISSNSNIITANTFSYTGTGIWIINSNFSFIYSNNFVDNSHNVEVESWYLTNTWNSQEKITYTYKGTTYTNNLGNYWDDYTGSDANGDGIGDTSYTGSYPSDMKDEKDNYPLMEPFENYKNADYIKLGGYEINRVEGSVHGELNLTAVGGSASCSVTLEVIGPNGTTIYSETKSVPLSANIETTVLFDWVCGVLPLGDYFARFRVRNETDNSSIFNSGWFFGFSVESEFYNYSFGSIGASSTKTWSDPLTLDRHQFAVFDFTLSSDVEWIDITLEGGWKSSFFVTVGNVTLLSVRDIYLAPVTSVTWRIYNIPSGSYNITIVSKSSSASLSKLEINASNSLVEDIIIGDLRDLSGVRYQFSGLCGSTKTYYLDVVYVTVVEEDISVSVSNSSIGVFWNRTLKTHPFSTSRTATFQIDLEFPSQPYTSTVSVEANLQTSLISDAKEIPLVSIEQNYDIDLEYETTTYFRVPSHLCVFDPHMELPIDESQLKALEVSNIQIVDVNVGSDGRIDNITVSFHIKNKYESGILWWKYYVHYDLYVYPVKVGDIIIERYVTGMVAGEQEDILVSGIHVEYIGNNPTVNLRIIFEKSPLLNVFGIGLEKAIGIIPLPISSSLGKISLLCADGLVDYIRFRMTAQDVEHILNEVYGSSYKDVLNKYYHTDDLTDLIWYLDPRGLLMNLGVNDPSNSWKIVKAIIVKTLNYVGDEPEILINIIGNAFEAATGKPIEVAADAIRDIINEAFPTINAIDTLFDIAFKLTANDREIKQMVMGFSGPYIGTPSYPSFSDPIIKISFTGQTSESMSNYVKFYDVLWIRVETNRTGTDQGTVTIIFTPFENSTGMLMSIFSDDLIRCGILSMFGVSVESSNLSQEGGNIILSGSGELNPSTYNRLILEIDENTVQGFVEQNFMAQEAGGWFTVNQTVLYTYGQNMSYTLEMELPADANSITVLTPGYTIDENKITWNTQVDQVIVQYKLTEEASPPLWILILLMLLASYSTGTPLYYFALIGVGLAVIIAGIAVYLKKQGKIGASYKK